MSPIQYAAVAVAILSAVAVQSLPAIAPSPAAAQSKGSKAVVITLVGDTGFAPNNASVRAKGVTRHGQYQSWADTTKEIARLINGDLNFLNVETVVTDRNDLRRDTKGQRGPFNFRSHPNGIAHLVSKGFNVLSLANNHSMDYGARGLKETLRHVKAMKGAGLKAFAGLGMNREEASRPQLMRVKGSGVAFSAIGIVTNNLSRHRAGPNKPGQIAYRFDDDFALSISRLAKAPAAYRMLSIHYGIEGRVRADSRQLKDFRGKAALGKGIDLIIGHHAHVPRAVEVAGSSVIFYGLGNFLHHGTANMTSKGICKDYGLMARVHLLPDGKGHLRARAIEAIPLTNTHRQPRPLTGQKGAARIHALNYLAGRLAGAGGKAQRTRAAGGKISRTNVPRTDVPGTDVPGEVYGVRFTPQADGRGLFCFAGAAQAPGSIGRLCRNWKPAPPIPPALRGRIARSCRR